VDFVWPFEKNVVWLERKKEGGKKNTKINE
jgi:hypothetical protein